MKVLTGGLIITTAFMVAWTRHRIIQWGKWVRNLEEELLFTTMESDVTIPDPSYSFSFSSSSWGSLPPSVVRYLRTALPTQYRSRDDPDAEDGHGGIPAIHSLQFYQEGYFYFGSTWVPFEAKQVIRASSPPGFLWDATISMTDRFRSSKNLQDSWWPTMQVCDAWVDGGKQAYMRATLVNVFEAVYAKSTISDEDDDDAGEDQYLWVGQAMRWLGEAFMVPTVLLPSRGLVEWTSGGLLEGEKDANKVILSLLDPRHGIPNRHVSAVKLEVEFDPNTGYPIRVLGRRPYEREILDKTDDLFPLFTRKRTSWEWRPWVGEFGQFKVHDDDDDGAGASGIVVPTHMEAGWVGENGEVEYYFKGDNIKLQYQVIVETDQKHKTSIVEAVVAPEVVATMS
jgi:hypothetical protein